MTSGGWEPGNRCPSSPFLCSLSYGCSMDLWGRVFGRRQESSSQPDLCASLSCGPRIKGGKMMAMVRTRPGEVPGIEDLLLLGGEASCSPPSSGTSRVGGWGWRDALWGSSECVLSWVVGGRAAISSSTVFLAGPTPTCRKDASFTVLCPLCPSPPLAHPPCPRQLPGFSQSLTRTNFPQWLGQGALLCGRDAVPLL